MKSLKLGVIGAGGRGNLAKYAHQPDNGCVLAAGMDVSEKALDAFRKQYGDSVKTYSDYRTMIRKSKLDGVFITSPDFCHEAQALFALKHHVPVYLEKPMAISLRGCDRILKAAHDNKTKLFLGHNMRYMNFVLKMKELIDQGMIGEVKAIWCRHFISYGGDAYFRDWHSEQKNTYSLLLQKAAHDIDVIHWLAGSYSRRVTGFGSLSVYDKCARRKPDEPGNPRFDAAHWPPLAQTGFSPVIDVEDQNMILMQLKNGIQAAYLQCHFTPDQTRNYTVIGTRGRLENYGDTIEVWTERKDWFSLHGDKQFVTTPTSGSHGGADEKIVEGFIKYLRDECTPNTSPVAARYSVATGYLGAKSIRAGGKPFEIPELDPKLEKYVY